MGVSHDRRSLGDIRRIFLRLGTSRCQPGRTKKASAHLITLRAHLACSNSGDGVRDYCTYCAATVLTEPYASSRAIGLDPAFALSVSNDHWSIAFDRYDRRRHRRDGVPRIYAKTVRGSLWRCPCRYDCWDN